MSPFTEREVAGVCTFDSQNIEYLARREKFINPS